MNFRDIKPDNILLDEEGKTWFHFSLVAFWCRYTLGYDGKWTAYIYIDFVAKPQIFLHNFLFLSTKSLEAKINI